MGTKREQSACLILAAGEILDYNALAEGLPPGVFVLCADGGYRHCAPLGLAADLLVGDFDSLRALPDGVPRVDLIAEKNYSDTQHAVQEARDRGFDRLILAGMLGGRVDHALANLQTLVWCARDGVDAVLCDGRTEIRALCGEEAELVLPARDGVYFSLLAHSDVCRGVTITGGKYPLNDYDLRNTDPRAISNEFSGRDVRIHLRGGALLVIVTPKDNTE